MNSAKESNVKSIAIIAFVSVLLFGIFYYLITDISSSPSLKTDKDTARAQTTPQVLLADSEKPTQQAATVTAPEKSAFKDLAEKRMATQPQMVLSGSDTNAPESTVPATGSDTIFGMFVVSSLIMFTGIYLLLAQPKNIALAKFEKRIIRELD